MLRIFMTNDIFASNCCTIVYINLNLPCLFKRKIKNSVRSMIFYFSKFCNRFIYYYGAPYIKK